MATVKLNKRTIDGLSVERGDRVFWDCDLAGIRHTGPCHRAQGLCRPGAHPGRPAEARGDRALCFDDRRGGATQGVGDDRPYPARRGSRAAAGAARADGGRSRGALHGRACGAELPPGDGGDLPPAARPARPARVGRAHAGGSRPLACRGAAPRAAGQAESGEPGGGRVLEDVQAGGGLGHDPGPAQPLPVDQALQGEELRALPDRGRIRPPRAGCFARPRPKAR